MIARAGHIAEHVADIGMLAAADSPIWDYALQHGAVVVTKDEDFPHRSGQSTTAPSIVWLRIGNASRRALLEWFEPLLPQIEAKLEQGEKLIEVR